MTFTWIGLFIAALATWEIVEIWRHGSIFATWRARLELLDGFVPQLLLCGFCLAPWVGVWTAIFMFVQANTEFGEVMVNATRLGLAGFAVARLANLGNDLTHAWCRTPNSKNTFEAGPNGMPQYVTTPKDSDSEIEKLWQASIDAESKAERRQEAIDAENKAQHRSTDG